MGVIIALSVPSLDIVANHISILPPCFWMSGNSNSQITETDSSLLWLALLFTRIACFGRIVNENTDFHLPQMMCMCAFANVHKLIPLDADRCVSFYVCVSCLERG